MAAHLDGPVAAVGDRSVTASRPALSTIRPAAEHLARADLGSRGAEEKCSRAGTGRKLP